MLPLFSSKIIFLKKEYSTIDGGKTIMPVPEPFSRIVFFPETFDALLKLQKYFLLFVVTNQVGVAKGLISREDVNRINSEIVKTFTDVGIEIADIYVCSHNRSDNCECIKPKPYFLQKASRDYHIDLQRSFVVGDHPCDVQLAKNVGARGIFILTGHGSKHVDELPEDAEVASGIVEATKRVLS